jgi:hypothetical protein
MYMLTQSTLCFVLMGGQVYVVFYVRTVPVWCAKSGRTTAGTKACCQVAQFRREMINAMTVAQQTQTHQGDVKGPVELCATSWPLLCSASVSNCHSDTIRVCAGVCGAFADVMPCLRSDSNFADGHV